MHHLVVFVCGGFGERLLCMYICNTTMQPYIPKNVHYKANLGMQREMQRIILKQILFIR